VSGLRASVYLNPEHEAPRIVYLDVPLRDHQSMGRQITSWIVDDLLDECPTALLMTVDPMRRSAIEHGWKCRSLIDLCGARCELVAERPDARVVLEGRVWQAVMALRNTLWRLEQLAVVREIGE